MFRRLRQFARGGEDGQSLVLLALALVVVMGATGMSIDVGRAYWAKQQMQSAVDAAALAAAQSLPDTSAATTQANTYWDLNNNFLEDNASNLVFTPSYNIASTKEVTVTASAEVNTWFAKVLGISSWNISADATAEFLQVDAVVVLDRSGSMCWDNYGPNGNYYGLVRLSDGNLSSSSTSMPSSDAAGYNRQIGVAKHSSVSGQSLSNLIWIGQRFKFDSTSEFMEVVSINSETQITVKRGVGDPNSGSSSTSRSSHSAGSSAWMRGSACPQAGKGPYYPWQYVKNGGTVFVNNMNSVYDQIAYVDFATTGTLNSDFTTAYTTLKSTINGTYDPGVISSTNMNGDGSYTYTNIQHGLWWGVNQHLTSTKKRAGVEKVIVLLSDGVANHYCPASTASAINTSCNGGAVSNTSTAKSKTIDVANYAKANNIKVYTISYGNDADPDLMQQVADITGGKHYIAPNEATLNTAFSEIAKSTHVKLTK